MAETWITLGPSSLPILGDLINVGVKGVRLTFSFGTPQLQEDRAKLIKVAADRVGTTCLAIADLPGEKVRIGHFDGAETIEVTAGEEFEIAVSEREKPSVSRRIPLPHAKFVASLSVGDCLVIGDGSAVATIESVNDGRVIARARQQGVINQTRGVTLQGGSFVPSCLTETDLDNLAFIGRSTAFDMVALSFVSTPSDVETARSILAGEGCFVPIIAKIETSAGLRNLHDICSVSDLVMAARGDLALAIPWIELPEAVESIACSAIDTRTPWILATQVAEGLERFAFPTRAEISDLAHWLKRGCAAVMLSYETVFGRNAAGAVECTDAMIRHYRDLDGLAPDGLYTLAMRIRESAPVRD